MPCKNFFIEMMTSELGDYCCPNRLLDEISKNMKNVLIIDCRSQHEYTRRHIRGAINVSLPSLMIKRLKRGNLNMCSAIQNNEAKDRFSKYSKTSTIILYDDCSTDLNVNPSSVINLLLKKLRQDGCRASFLLGGFSTFEERFPEYCQSPDQESNIVGLCNLRISEQPKQKDNESTCSTSSPVDCPIPVKVVSYLYLGCAKNSADLSQLKRDGISYILNVTSNVPNMFENEDDFRYLQIPISDHWTQNLSSFFPQAIQFIDEARNNKKGVLVHCLAGISRSVTITVAYLMYRKNMSLNQAYDYVKRVKPNISPNFTFMGQLLDYEKNLSGDRSNYSSDEILTSDSDKLSPTSSNFSPV